MKIVQSFLTKNPCYKARKKIKVKGLMLHSVGCEQSSASVFIKSWNRTDFNRACVHAFIDGNNGKVYQTLPWNHRGWHCGGAANNTHIGIEMCEPDVKDKVKARAIVQRTYDTAVLLFAQLCTTYDLDPTADIIGHKEGAKKGIASNHSDPEHIWKKWGMGYTMDTFRKAVKSAMAYKVKVTADTLNVRKGADVNHAVTTTIRKGEVYTIVGESNGWGKLKSGAGWINLKYTKRI